VFARLLKAVVSIVAERPALIETLAKFSRFFVVLFH